MSPVMRVSDETWGRLKKLAEPLEDSPEDVIKRALDIAERKAPGVASNVPGVPVQRSPRGGGMGTRFARDILLVLRDAGEPMPSREVLKELQRRLQGQLQPRDLTEEPSGQVRWHHRVHIAKNLLKKAGLVEDVQHAVWHITEKGRDEVGSDDPIRRLYRWVRASGLRTPDEATAWIRADRDAR